MIAIGSAVLLLVATAAAYQEPAARIAVQGSCQVTVNVQQGASNTATCDFYIEDSETDTVPAAAELLLEHASAHCAGPQAGEIAYLAIYTRSTGKAPAQPAYIPLIRRPFRNGATNTRYLASAPVRLYGAGGTKVTVKLALEPDVPLPLGYATSCDVRLQGHLRPGGKDGGRF